MTCFSSSLTQGHLGDGRLHLPQKVVTAELYALRLPPHESLARSVWETDPQYAFLRGIQPDTSDTAAWLSSTDGPTTHHPAILGLDL